MKYLLLAVLIISCSKENKLAELKPAVKEPIALVRHGDTIYHCSQVEFTECGLKAECGKYSLMCLNHDIHVEYIE